MTYQLEISFKPVYELVISMHTFLCKSWYKKIDLGMEWPQKVQASLSPEFADQLEKIDTGLEWKLLQLLAYVSPNNDKVDDFLLWLKSLSLGQLYETLSPYIQTFPEDFRAVRDRLHDVLAEWNQVYFKHVDQSTISRLQSAVENISALDGMNAYEQAAQLTNGFCFEPVNGLEKLVLIPQFHFQPGNIVFSFGSLTICYYAARIEPSSDEDDPSLQLYRLLRSLSEKSRLRILRFLRDEPRSFIEVVRHLGISKGITHDHISNLRSAGLLNAHIVGESISAYSLRVERIRQIESELLDYLGINEMF